MFYVYVIQDTDRQDRFYIGQSGDLKRRLAEHNSSNNHSTRGRRWRLVYYEAYLLKDAAIKRELVLKGDGRTRRHLMDRVNAMLAEQSAIEPFNGGEWQTGE